MLFKPLNLSQFLSASGKLSSQKSKNAIRPFTRVVRARIERKRKKETEYSVEGEGFCSSLSPLRTTDRSGRGIAAGKSVKPARERVFQSLLRSLDRRAGLPYGVESVRVRPIKRNRRARRCV